MSNIFVFDPVLFKEIYPQFKDFSDELLEFFFEKAESTLLDNTECACVPIKERKFLFYLLVAHYAELQQRINEGNSSLVGRVSSASEGSVSISTEFNLGTSSVGQWLNQTPYGSEYWMAISKYKTALYVIENKAMPVDRFNRWI